MYKALRFSLSNLANRDTIWNVSKVALAIVLAAYVLTRVSVNDLSRTWQRLSLVWLSIDILFFVALVWCMARRYWLLIGRPMAFRELLGLSILQTAIGNLVATSAGAASYVVFLRGRYQVHVVKGIGSLLLARFFDMLLLLIALAASSSMVWRQVTNLQWPIMLLLAVLLSGAMCLPILYIFRSRLIRALRSLSARLRLDRFNIVSQVFRSLDKLAGQDTSELRSLIGGVMIYSCLIFALNLGFAYSSVRLFAVPIGTWPIIFILSLTQLVALIPIQVFGGLGVFDVTLLYLYGLFGFSQAEMAPVIIGWRVIFYVLNLLLFLYLPIGSRLASLPSRKLSHQ